MTDLQANNAGLDAIVEKVYRIRNRKCEPNATTNPRYIALSNVVTNLRKPVGGMRSQL